MAKSGASFSSSFRHSSLLSPPSHSRPSLPSACFSPALCWSRHRPRSVIFFALASGIFRRKPLLTLRFPLTMTLRSLCTGIASAGRRSSYAAGWVAWAWKGMTVSLEMQRWLMLGEVTYALIHGEMGGSTHFQSSSNSDEIWVIFSGYSY